MPILNMDIFGRNHEQTMNEQTMNIKHVRN